MGLRWTIKNETVRLVKGVLWLGCREKELTEVSGTAYSGGFYKAERAREYQNADT
jgi:hypothetical protein